MSGLLVGRNDLCPCGSGKKFKKCCLALQSGPPSDPLFRTPPTPAAPQPQPDTRSRIPPVDPSLKAFEWVEYVFVKGKGWTHESELKPGDQYRLKGGG